MTLALACGGESGTGDSSSGSGSSGGGGSSSDGSATETGAADSTDGGSDSESGASGSSGDAPTTTDGTTTTTDGATTGELAWCHGWQGDEGGAPYLELYSDDVLLADGGVLHLECGGQGLYMFGLYPKFGGFTPDQDSISFAVTVDVEGHNIGPEGHFYSTSEYIYYVGCDDIIGGVLGVVPVFPPDNDDPLTLGGLPATVKVVMQAAGETVEQQLAVTLAVDPNGMFEFCGQG